MRHADGSKLGDDTSIVGMGSGPIPDDIVTIASVKHEIAQTGANRIARTHSVYLFELKAGMKRVLLKQPVGSPTLDAALRPAERRRSPESVWWRTTSQGVRIERTGAPGAMLGCRLFENPGCEGIALGLGAASLPRQRLDPADQPSMPSGRARLLSMVSGEQSLVPSTHARS
jgi:hypothetical protein